MARRFLPLAFVVALVTGACAEPPHAELEFGSGTRFVPLVADSLNDAGRYAQVVVDDSDRPIVSYFAFEEQTREGVLPQNRPVGAPSIPGVLAATVSEDGIWTRGAIALQANIPNVQVPFNPGFDPAIADLAAGDVTGLDVVVAGDRFHAVWGSADGTFYASGSTDPNATEQATISRVSQTTPLGPSIAVSGGAPWIAYYGSASVNAATPAGNAWSIETVAETDTCDTCRTSVVGTATGPVVAWSTGGNGVRVATRADGVWSARDISASGGQGLAAAMVGDQLALSYYAGGEIQVASGSVDGRLAATTVGPAAEGSLEEEGPGTSVAVDERGTVWVAWVDADEGVRFASGDGESFDTIDTGADTATGAMPSIAVTPDGATAYVAWYDTQHEDVLLGVYGEIEELALAEPSPEPTAPPAPPPAEPDGECTEAVDGVVEITASGLAFDTSCIDVPAGEPFTITFGNQDADQHNVAIYRSADDVADPLFRGEIFGGPATREYPPVDPLDAGEYYFQCDVHPQMNGTLNAVQDGDGGNGEDGGGGGGGGGGALTVTAQNIAFDTDTIELPADTESTITFDNQDTVQHNIAIYTDDTLAENLFRGELVTAETIDYTIPPLEAGEYYFHCDVHPQMNGTVVVG